MYTNQTDFLTPKQQLFCDEYLISRNACEAALKAGYSRSTAMNGQLMQLPKIKLHLQNRMAEVSARCSMSHDILLSELKKVAFMNMANYFDSDGKVKPLTEIDANAMAAVQAITIAPDGTVQIKLCNKMVALDRIARHLNFYSPDTSNQQVQYVYLNHDHLTQDDQFDDERLKQEIAEQKKQDATLKRQEENKQRRMIDKQKKEEARQNAMETVVPDETETEVIQDDEPEVIVSEPKEEVMSEVIGVQVEATQPAPPVVERKPAPVLTLAEHNRNLDKELMSYGISPGRLRNMTTREKTRLARRERFV